jgi:hypothetical protein
VEVEAEAKAKAAVVLEQFNIFDSRTIPQIMTTRKTVVPNILIFSKICRISRHFNLCLYRISLFLKKICFVWLRIWLRLLVLYSLWIFLLVSIMFPLSNYYYLP